MSAILILGGCRSGKSDYAEDLANDLSGEVTYLATSKIFDEEFEERVKKHRERRPAGWKTIEEALEIERIFEEGDFSGEEVIIIESLSSWITNLMYDIEYDGFSKEEEILKRVERLIRIITEINVRVLIVSDEVGFGVIPPYPDGRLFRDLNGKANQMVAASADYVYFVVAGIPTEIKSTGKKKE